MALLHIYFLSVESGFSAALCKKKMFQLKEQHSLRVVWGSQWHSRFVTNIQLCSYSRFNSVVLLFQG